MNQYFIGKVYVLESLPPDQSFTVEFPLGTQSVDTPLSLLLSLPVEDLEPVSKDRVDDIFKRSSLSPETLRANRHVFWESQEQIAAEMRERMGALAPLLSWKGVPTGQQLEAVCDLIFRYLSQNALRENGIFSGDQLAWHLNALRIGRDFTSYIHTCVGQRRLSDSPSAAVENALRVVRNVICQRFPRDLMVIDAIQREILTKMGRPPGEYSLFAEQAENLFMSSVLFALDEYGVPIQTAQSLEPWLMPADSLDDVLRRFRDLPLARLGLSPFEEEIVSEVCETLFPFATIGRAERPS